MQQTQPILVRVPIQGDWDDSDDSAIYPYFQNDSRWHPVIHLAVNAVHSVTTVFDWFVCYINGFYGIVRDQMIDVSFIQEGSIRHITTTVVFEQRDGNPLRLSLTRSSDSAIEFYRRKYTAQFEAHSTNMVVPFRIGDIPRLASESRAGSTFLDWCQHASRDLLGGPNETPEQKAFREAMERRSPLYGVRPLSTHELLHLPASTPFVAT